MSIDKIKQLAEETEDYSHFNGTENLRLAFKQGFLACYEAICKEPEVFGFVRKEESFYCWEKDVGEDGCKEQCNLCKPKSLNYKQ